MSDGHKQRNRHDDGLGEGQHHPEKDGQVVGAVNAHGFEQGRRHTVVAHQDHVVDTEQVGQDEHQEVVQQAQVFQNHVVRDHAAAEIHREDKQQVQRLAAHQLFAGEHIGQSGGDQNGQRRTDGGAGQGDQDGMLGGFAAQNVGVAGQTDFPGQEIQTAAHSICGIVDRNNEDIPEGVDADHDRKHQEHDLDYVKNHIGWLNFTFHYVDLFLALRMEKLSGSA